MIEVSEVDDLIHAALTQASLNEDGTHAFTVDFSPDDPTDENFKRLGSKQCLLVQHAGVVYDEPSAKGQQDQKQQIAVTSSILAGARSLRRSGGNVGALDLLTTARNTVSGMVVGLNPGGYPIFLSPRVQTYVGRFDGIYWYKLLFEHRDVYTSTLKPDPA